MLADVEIIVTALGGSTEALEGFDTGLVFEGPSRAVYPQVTPGSSAITLGGPADGTLSVTMDGLPDTP